MLILDFETRSRCNLLVKGSYAYANDPTTDVLCMAAWDQETERKWLWYPDEDLPESLRYRLKEAEFVAAHNAEFDKGIYEQVAVKRYGFPEIELSRWYCTSAQCRVNGLPASLDHAAWALGLQQRKMAKGKHLIKLLSIPKPDGTFREDENALIEMGEYCMQDVITTAAVAAATRVMTAQEHQDWLKTVEMNNRGVMVDTYMAELAVGYADAEQLSIADRLNKLTNGAITSHTQTARLRVWLQTVLPPESPVLEMMEVWKDGKMKFSLDKNIRRNIISGIENGTLDIEPEIGEVIQLLDAGNKSSVAKFKKMLDLAGEDDRVRGAFMFAGAAQTLRYTSRGLQLHNMRRDCWSPEETEDLIDRMEAGDMLDNTMDDLSKALRPAIVPDDGNVFIVGDWSSIEARVLPWLSDSDGGDDKLELFKQGKDVYVEAANRMGIDDRQIGKVAELACGYQGGAGAFQAMAKIYGLNMTDDEAKLIVDKWRKANSWAVAYWAEVEQAAKAAMVNPMVKYPAGMIDYMFVPNLMDGTLICMMAGNNIIQYPKARVEEVLTPWGSPTTAITALKASVQPKADAKEWSRSSLYGGLLVENMTQAFAAAILRNALRNLDNVIGSVHDEIILEVPESEAAQRLDELTALMNTAPDWAEGLPLVAKPVIMRRYGK